MRLVATAYECGLSADITLAHISSRYAFVAILSENVNIDESADFVFFFKFNRNTFNAFGFAVEYHRGTVRAVKQNGFCPARTVTAPSFIDIPVTILRRLSRAARISPALLMMRFHEGAEQLSRRFGYIFRCGVHVALFN